MVWSLQDCQQIVIRQPQGKPRLHAVPSLFSVFSLVARRNSNSQMGLQISTASQVRYIAYVEEVCRLGGYQMAGVVMKRIRLFTCPRVDLGNGCNLWYTVEEGRAAGLSCRQREKCQAIRPVRGESLRSKNSAVRLQAISV